MEIKGIKPWKEYRKTFTRNDYIDDFDVSYDYVMTCALSEEVQKRCPEDRTKFMGMERDRMFISPKGNVFVRLSFGLKTSKYSGVVWVPSPVKLVYWLDDNLACNGHYVIPLPTPQEVKHE